MDGQVKNLRDWGIPLGRRFRALKLWFLIREQGVAGLQARLRRDLANARWLADAVRTHRRLARAGAGAAADGVRAPRAAGRLTGEALDRHTLAWVERINRSGAAYLTPATARRALDGPRVGRRRGHRTAPTSSNLWRNDAVCRRVAAGRHAGADRQPGGD